MRALMRDADPDQRAAIVRSLALHDAAAAGGTAPAAYQRGADRAAAHDPRTARFE
jgi:hypothetical protein